MLDFNMVSGSRLASLVKWINVVLPNFNLPLETSEEEFRACLRDGSVLCSILDKLVPGSLEGVGLCLSLCYMLIYSASFLFFFLFRDYVYINFFVFCFLFVLKLS